MWLRDGLGSEWPQPQLPVHLAIAPCDPSRQVAYDRAGRVDLKAISGLSAMAWSPLPTGGASSLLPRALRLSGRPTRDARGNLPCSKSTDCRLSACLQHTLQHPGELCD